MMNDPHFALPPDQESKLSQRADKLFAFFDVDETLINEKSMFVMLHVIEDKTGGIDAQKEIDRLHALRDGGLDRASVNRAFYALLSGFKQKDIIQIAEAYVTWRIKNDARFPYFIASVLERLNDLKSKGISVVLISGSCVDFLEPLRHHLGAVASLATRLSVNKDGYYTGNIKGEPVIGPGKLSSITKFLAHQGTALSKCHGYGDHSSDLDFLSAVGFPTVVGNDVILRLKAKSCGWKIIDSEAVPSQAFKKNNNSAHNAFAHLKG